jgi:phosphohistidine swiveling domain-containing protein
MPSLVDDSSMDNEWGLVDMFGEQVDQVPIEVRVPPGYWRRDDTHLPLPVTPMTDSVIDTDAAFSAACADFGLLIDVRLTAIGGWYYVSVVPVGAKPNAPAPPGWLLPLLLRLSPAARARMRRSREVARTGYVDQVIDRWYNELLPAFERRITALRDAGPAGMDDNQLVSHLRAAQDLSADGLRAHFRVNMTHWLATGELSSICRDLLGWGQTEVYGLLAGLSTRSSEPARKLAALAGTAQDSPEFADYMRVYGTRSLTLELADPTIGELPGLMWTLLQDQIQQQYDPENDAATLASRRETMAQTARDSLRGEQLARFERALARAVRAYPVREDNVFFTNDVPNALIRFAILEAGRRLYDRNQLSNRDDVFFLELDEAVAALKDGEGKQALVALRKGEHGWALANPGPPAYGKDPGPPPSTRWLRPDLRASTDAMMLTSEQVLASDLSNRTEETPGLTTLTGVAGSPGTYRGPVRVIKSENEFDKLQAGDVLVCPATRPSWSVLFPSVGAIVTDAGGALSHPAIIAREHRVPAVVATGFATSTLRDGLIVTVDGTRGIVEVEA